MKQAINYQSGLMAEDIVAQKYQNAGFDILGRRVRNSSGEIDIIAGHFNKLYFIEVKASTTFERAAERISSRQMGRIQNAALRYLAQTGRKQETDMRFDAALVNRQGQVKIIPNAFAPYQK